MQLEPIHFVAALYIAAFSLILIMVFAGIYFAARDIWYNLFRTPHYICYVLDNGFVTHTLIEKAKGQWYLTYNKHAVLIPKSIDIRRKSSLIFYADVKNGVSISLLDTEQQKNLEKIREYAGKKTNKQKAIELLQKIPIVHSFYVMKKSYTTVDEVVLASKLALNPNVIIDACSLYTILTSNSIEMVMKNPTTIYDVLKDNAAIIVIGCVAIIFILFRSGI